MFENFSQHCPCKTWSFLLEIFAIFALLSLSKCEDFAKVEGDLTIVGLFEIEKKDGNACGEINIESVMILEATRWYIDQLNKNSSLPFKLGFQGYKTCGLPSRAVEQTLKYVVPQKNCQLAEQNNTFIVGILDAITSTEAETVLSVLNSRAEDDWFLQISATATATTLGNRIEYPNFYRVIPDDSKQIETMILLMKKLQWNRIAIMYEDSIYCKDCALAIKEQAQQNLICVSKLLAISVSNAGDVTVDQINGLLDDIMQQTPVIGGVILFASKDVANKVLYAVESKGVANVPLFILSESVGLTNDVFLSASGVPMSKTKGSISVSPPYSEIIPFTEYWQSLLTDLTLLKEQAIDNPWLNDMFKSVSGCDPELSNVCQNLTLEEAQSKIHMQPVYLKYAILAAHTMAKALQQLYMKVCSGSSANCLNKFRADFTPAMMTEEMDGLKIDFETDFNPDVFVDPLSSSKYQMIFGNQAEPMSTSDHEVYQIYNFRKDSLSGRNVDFRLLKVGSLTGNHEVLLDLSELRDYNSDGTENTFPNVRIPRCPEGWKCSECISPDIPDLYLHIPGDLYVIGIVPVNNKAIPGPIGCGAVRTRDGYQVALSLQYGIEMFNYSTDFYDSRMKFGDKQIGLIVINSCYNNLTIARKILDLHVNGLTLENGEHIDLSNRILGYVGGLSTWVSVSAATLLTITGHIQISYAATYPILSDTVLYPYFMRIVSPDGVQADAMMRVVKAIKGEYVQVVYNECSCGSARKDSVAAMARKHGICVAQYIQVKEKDSYFEFYELIRRKPHAKLVVIFLSSHILTNFMRDLNEQMPKGEFQFLGSETWGNNHDLLKFDITKGSLLVTMEIDEIKGLRSYIQEKIPNRNKYEPWLEQYIQKRQDCYFDWSHDKTFSRQCTDDILPPAQEGYFKMDSTCGFATYSLFALLKGSAEFYRQSCGNSAVLCDAFVNNPVGLYEEMKEVSMDLSGIGPTKLFDSIGDGNLGFQIYNIKVDFDNDALIYTRVGRYNLKTGMDINTGNIVFPTGEEMISACPNEQACQGCSETSPTEKEPSKDSLDGGKVALGVIVGILALIVIVLVILFLLEKRKEKEDPYLTPSVELIRPEAVGKSDSPYHSAEMIPSENPYHSAKMVPSATPCQAPDMIQETKY